MDGQQSDGRLIGWSDGRAIGWSIGRTGRSDGRARRCGGRLGDGQPVGRAVDVELETEGNGQNS